MSTRRQRRLRPSQTTASMDLLKQLFGPAPTPPFSLDAASRFPQNTYVGRCRHFFQVISPTNLFISDAELADAQAQLARFRATGREKSGLTDEQLWRAKLVRDSTLHPDTGDKVPLPFRMSAFAPVNIPIVAGMIYAAPTIGNTLFWQWVNQSANVAVNYANRNASNEMSNEQIFKAYAAAVATSCSLAIGLGHWAKRSQSTIIPKFVPFVSVATAGALNVLLMRRSEAETGISVKDHEGVTRGNSKRAGEMALQQVALTRIALPAPVLLLPPLLMRAFESFEFVRARPALRGPAQIVSITASLLFALPLAIGVFPQNSQVAVEELEPEFRQLTDSRGARITSLVFNKGL